MVTASKHATVPTSMLHRYDVLTPWARREYNDRTPPTILDNTILKTVKQLLGWYAKPNVANVLF